MSKKVFYVSQKEFNHTVNGFVNSFGGNVARWPKSARDWYKNARVEKETAVNWVQAGLPFGNTGVSEQNG